MLRVVGKSVRFEGRLDLPAFSNNAIHEPDGRGGVRLSPDAVKWGEDVALLLRRDGLRALAPLKDPWIWWIQVWLVVETQRLDLDSVFELLLNVVKLELGVDDRFLGDVRAVKRWVHRRPDEGVRVWIYAEPVADKVAFNAVTERYSGFEILEPMEDGHEG